MKNTKNIPASVSALLGKKLNKIHVLKFNEKKSKPAKPVVRSRRLAHFIVTDMAFLPDLS
jgi:predicted RNase H-like HicB family nuclease